MSDLKNEANEAAQPEQTVMLQIVMDKEGNVGVGGLAIGDKTMAYGLLAVAKDIIRDMHQPKVVKPSGGLIKHLRNGRF